MCLQGLTGECANGECDGSRIEKSMAFCLGRTMAEVQSRQPTVNLVGGLFLRTPLPWSGANRTLQRLPPLAGSCWAEGPSWNSSVRSISPRSSRRRSRPTRGVEGRARHPHGGLLHPPQLHLIVGVFLAGAPGRARAIIALEWRRSTRGFLRLGLDWSTASASPGRLPAFRGEVGKEGLLLMQALSVEGATTHQGRC
jgi:hypothetical protein